MMGFSPEDIQVFKWPISVSKKIAAPPGEVWAAISRPGNLKDCHPFCESNPVEEWPGIGARDTIHYYSGWVLQREFTNWIEGVGYDLTIGREGGRQSTVVWRITEGEENTSTLSITIYPHALQNVPVIIRWIPHLVSIKPSLQRYLESVVSGFEWFITTGKPVQKNQFGAHPWFSN